MFLEIPFRFELISNNSRKISNILAGAPRAVNEGLSRAMPVSYGGNLAVALGHRFRLFELGASPHAPREPAGPLRGLGCGGALDPPYPPARGLPPPRPRLTHWHWC